MNIESNLPPLSKELPEFIFPKYNVEQIDKIRIYLFEDKSQPLINLKIMYPNGASNYSTPGLAYFSSQMLTCGTKQLTAPQIAEMTDSMGAHFNVNTNHENTTLTFVSLNEFLDKAIDISISCLQESIFQEEEISRLKKKHISSIEQDSAESNYLCELAFNAEFYEGTNYQYPVIGTIDSIKGINRNDCFFRHSDLLSNYYPAIILTGFFDSEGTVDIFQSRSLTDKLIKNSHEIKDGFAQNNELQFQNNQDNKYNRDTKVAIINKEDAAQTTLKIGRNTINRNHSDYPLLQLANVIFGGYFQSRLNMLLREKHGYTYGIHSSLENKLTHSLMSIHSNVNTQSTAHSVELILQEIQNIEQQPVSGEELESAKQYMLGSFLRSCESIQGISQLLRVIELFGLPEDYFTKFFNTIKNAGIDELYKVQKEYFSVDSLTISASGDRRYLENELKRFGSINLYDKNGNIIN
jgi:zinc protease